MVLEDIEWIERNALSFAKVIDVARRVDLHQFPYSLWFRIQGDAIIIACRTTALARERALGIPPLGWSMLIPGWERLSDAYSEFASLRKVDALPS